MDIFPTKCRTDVVIVELVFISIHFWNDTVRLTFGHLFRSILKFLGIKLGFSTRFCLLFHLIRMCSSLMRLEDLKFIYNLGALCKPSDTRVIFHLFISPTQSHKSIKCANKRWRWWGSRSTSIEPKTDTTGRGRRVAVCRAAAERRGTRCGRKVPAWGETERTDARNMIKSNVDDFTLSRSLICLFSLLLGRPFF